MNSEKITENYLIENDFEPLKDHENKYLINKKGEVWSIKHKRILLGSFDKKNVHIVQIASNGKYKNYKTQDLIDIQYNDKFNEFIHYDLSEFEPLKDFEEFYKINREGQIWSNIYNKIMKETTSRDGYKKITLTNEIKNNNKRSIHRLLAIQYIPNPDNLEEVDHIDMNKLNNNLDNLRWASRSTNCRNRDSSYKTQGSLCECFDKKRNKIYYKAQYKIDYNVSRSKSSDDRQVCEDWLEQMIMQYPRDNKI
jgi:hypothetical protein